MTANAGLALVWLIGLPIGGGSDERCRYAAGAHVGHQGVAAEAFAPCGQAIAPCGTGGQGAEISYDRRPRRAKQSSSCAMASRGCAKPGRSGRVPLSALSRATPRGVNGCPNPQANQDMVLTWAIRPSIAAKPFYPSRFTAPVFEAWASAPRLDNLQQERVLVERDCANDISGPLLSDGRTPTTKPHFVDGAEAVISGSVSVIDR